MEKYRNKIKECDICDSNSTCLCFECVHYFCDSCYKYVHDKKKNSKHKKEALDPYVAIELRCPEHSKIPMTLFCLDEKGNYKFLFLILLNHRSMLFWMLPQKQLS